MNVIRCMAVILFPSVPSKTFTGLSYLEFVPLLTGFVSCKGQFQIIGPIFRNCNTKSPSPPKRDLSIEAFFGPAHFFSPTPNRVTNHASTGHHLCPFHQNRSKNKCQSPPITVKIYNIIQWTENTNNIENRDLTTSGSGTDIN